MDLKFYFQLFLRRIHWFLLFALLGSAIGLTLAAVLPPTYSSYSTLVVESAQIPNDLASSTVQTSPQEALQIIQQRILTRDSLLELANRLRVYEDGTGVRMTPDAIVRDLRDRIWINIPPAPSSRNGSGGATIVTVGFSAPRAGLAASVTNEVVDLLLQENVAIRTAVASQTLDFFVQEAERLDRELSDKNAEILSFQRENLNSLPDSLDFRRSQQAAAQERYVRLERDESALQDRRATLERIFEQTGQIGPSDPAQMSPEERQLAGMRDELQSLLIILSPQNPRIRMMEAQISALEERMAAAAPSQDAEERIDPQRAAYDLQLADIDTQLENIAEQKADIDGLLEQLQTSIDSTPANAIRLSTLERDYGALRTQYERAVANRASAETGDTIEALAKGQRISVIEPATVPAQPTSPNRPLIAGGGILGGIALGLGFVLLLELTNASIRRPVDIESKLGISPIGVLPYMRTRTQIWRRRAIIGAAFAVVAIGLPAALWYTHTYVTPLDLLIDRTVDRLRLASLVLPRTLA